MNDYCEFEQTLNMEPYTHKFLKNFEKSEKVVQKADEENEEAENADYDPAVSPFFAF